MKILFSNLPWWEESSDGLRQGIRAGSRWPFTRHAFHKPDAFEFGGYLPFAFFLGHAAAHTKMLLSDADVEVRDSIARGESEKVFCDYVAASRPDFIVIETATPALEHDCQFIAELGLNMPKTKVILCGPVDEKKYEELFWRYENIHAIVEGEYDKQIAKAIALTERRVLKHDLLTVSEMNSAPPPMWDEACATHYWDACPKGQKSPQLQLWTSRGCPFKCLAGDTPVNTVYGMIPIKELSERFSEVGVFSYDPIEKRAKVCTARNIRKIGEGETLVRVNFDNGSHIDCTSDHRFLAFKWGNQFTGEKEWQCEAKDLKPGMHLRAFKTSMSGKYIEGAWRRKSSEKIHLMIAEWKIGRRLTDAEEVHHDDRNKLNNRPENLIVAQNTKHHFSLHPEISERMRLNNPTKNGVSDEWRSNMSKSQKGKVRSRESRENYRRAAIKREALKRQRRDWSNQLINHRVLSVEPIFGEHDVYCLEVPETGWFYANNVLVKNCCFCVWPAVMTGHDPDGTKPRAVRHYSAEYVERHIRQRLALHPYQSIYLDDDTFNLQDKHVLEICEVMKRIGLPWSAMCRADTIKRETWVEMKESGCFGVKIGFESGSQYVIDHIVNKKLDLGKAAATCQWLQSIGISVHGTFTIGLPGETTAQCDETIWFIEKLYADGAISTHQLSGTAVVDGTPLDRIAHGEKLSKYDGATPEGFVPMSDGQRKIESMRE